MSSELLENQKVTMAIPITVTIYVTGDLLPQEDAAYFAPIVAEHIQRLFERYGMLLSECLPFREGRPIHARWAIHWKNAEVAKETPHA